MTPMDTIFALFIEKTATGWGSPAVALYHVKEDELNDWPGYHLWVNSKHLKVRRHFQVWPILTKRFLKTWD